MLLVAPVPLTDQTASHNSTNNKAHNEDSSNDKKDPFGKGRHPVFIGFVV
jgi:hypothetical protein